MGELTYIYSLEYPEGNIKYIGKSDNPKDRLRNHLIDAKNFTVTHKLAWLNGLFKKGLSPVLNIIDEVSQEEWPFWEIHYISLYKSWGFNLTNSTEGGDGIVNPTQKMRDKISDSLKKKYNSGELVTWNKGKETGQIPWNKDLPATEEFKNKVSEGVNKGFENGREVWNKGIKTGQVPWNKGKKDVMPEPWNKGKKGGTSWNKGKKLHYDVWNKGKDWPEETKEKLRRKVTCPYCSKEGGICAMKRWHFDNCKFKAA